MWRGRKGHQSSSWGGAWLWISNCGWDAAQEQLMRVMSSTERRQHGERLHLFPSETMQTGSDIVPACKKINGLEQLWLPTHKSSLHTRGNCSSVHGYFNSSHSFHWSTPEQQKSRAMKTSSSWSCREECPALWRRKDLFPKYKPCHASHPLGWSRSWPVSCASTGTASQVKKLAGIQKVQDPYQNPALHSMGKENT